MTTCKLHLHVILCVIAPHQLSLPSVLALWVALLGKEDFCLLCILPDSPTVPHPLGHLRRFCEGPLTKQAVPACVVAPSVLRFNMDRVNLEWRVIGGDQVHKVTPFNLLLQESLGERLCFLPTSPCMSSWPSSRLPLLGCTSGWGLPTAQVYCSRVDALHVGISSNPVTCSSLCHTLRCLRLYTLGPHQSW